VRSPVMIGVATLLSFMVVWFIPLLTYVIAAFFNTATTSLFGIAVWLTMTGFLLIGWVKSRTLSKWKTQAIGEILALGALAACVAYYVWFFLEKIITG
jgi:UDP-N-acetylmuramyl pentapeptide phosphotransferase/UDP-N-acetylglucosamine-1-phosphate transferase